MIYIMYESGISNIEKLGGQINQIENFLSKELGKKEKLLEQLNNISQEASKLVEKIEVLEKVSLLFQQTSEFAREQAKTQIESIVTNCLRFVFDSEIEFLIEIEELRNKASAEFYVITKAENLEIKTKPELSRGGGIVDIVSLALRIAFLQINKPQIEGPLILDEPAKHVSEDYIYNVGEFLSQSSEIFNRQIIMITHNNHLSAITDNAYFVDLMGTISRVKKIEN